MKTTFIYALCEPGTRTVRYIGKSDNPKRRFRDHLRASVKTETHLGRWLRLLLSLGEEPNLVVLREVPHDQWQLSEERYIRLARGMGMKLVNSTDGGEGVTMTPEIRAAIGASKLGKHNPKLSAAKLGKNNPSFGKTGAASPHFGKKRSLESRAKQSASHSGEKHTNFGKRGAGLPFFGCHHTPEHCAKISAGQLGEKNHQFGRVYTEAEKAAISASSKASWARRKERDQEIEWALAPYTLT